MVILTIWIQSIYNSCIASTCSRESIYWSFALSASVPYASRRILKFHSNDNNSYGFPLSNKFILIFIHVQFFWCRIPMHFSGHMIPFSFQTSINIYSGNQRWIHIYLHCTCESALPVVNVLHHKFLIFLFHINRCLLWKLA